jgi:nicotinate phosphoribosyltransferase
MLRRCPLLLDGRALLDADRLIGASLADRRASFELAFRTLPPHTGFLVVAGVESLLEMLGKPLIDPTEIPAAKRAAGLSDELAERLTRFSLTIDVDAVPDGTIVFPNAPIATIEGPFLEASLVASLLRATVRRATAIATRTARLHTASAGDPIIDGSSAQAASIDASLLVARAAYVGGASATTNVAAAVALELPFRASPALRLGPTGPLLETTMGEDAWGALEADEMCDLGAGDDEEAVLLEAKRCGLRSGGWIARGLDDAETRALSMRCDLVALEQQGAWGSPPANLGDDQVPTPGRKMVVRYTNGGGRAVADVVHLMAERMRSPRTLGAVTLAPLARPRVRGGHALELPETPSQGRERAIVERASLPEALTHLRNPAIYRVEQSPGVALQREEAEKSRVKLPRRPV